MVNIARNQCSYTQDKTTIKACNPLCEVISKEQIAENNSGVWHIENSADGEELEKTYFLIKGGLRKDKPALLNYCPFCGLKFDTPVNL